MKQFLNHNGFKFDKATSNSLIEGDVNYAYVNGSNAVTVSRVDGKYILYFGTKSFRGLDCTEIGHGLRAGESFYLDEDGVPYLG